MNDDLDGLYRDLRPYAFAIAYRMLGTVSDAEDIVQDVFLRLTDLSPGEVKSPKAYIATVTTRLAIDLLRSARVRRETYVGPWLPEPVVQAAETSASEPVELADSLSMAFLVLLEKLTPLERAAFLLHDVFGYEHQEVAKIVNTTEANCRQLTSRARRRLDSGKARFAATDEERQRLADQFFAACEGRDMDGLVSLLAGDVALYGDGGTAGNGIRHPVHGRASVTRVLLAWFRQAIPLGVQIFPTRVNCQPGAMLKDAEDRLINVISLDILDGQIQAVRSVINPDKLAHLSPLSPLGRRPSKEQADDDTW